MRQERVACWAAWLESMATNIIIVIAAVPFIAFYPFYNWPIAVYESEAPRSVRFLERQRTH